MARKKLQQYAELDQFDNVLHPVYNELKAGYKLREKWGAQYFKNGNPLILELGCGKGEYTVALAMRYPQKNFIGIDIKGARLWAGSRRAQNEGLQNVLFIRSPVEAIEKLFAPGEVSEIWLSFPDPQPKKRQVRKRLTAPAFLDSYKRILINNGIVHLKTDNLMLYEFTLEVIGERGIHPIENTDDLYASDILGDVVGVKTFYEEMFLSAGARICYLKFRP